MSPKIAKAEKAAEEILAEYKLLQAPIDPEAIAEARRIDVVYVKFRGSISEKVAGFSDPNHSRIVVNQELSSAEKTYTIAHELGHYVLHRDYLTDDGSYQVFLRQRGGYGEEKSNEEAEADAFASKLLIPDDILKEYKDFASPYELAEMFMVPRDVMLNRLRSL